MYVPFLFELVPFWNKFKWSKTNHINFRHIPVIAKALDRYEGAMIIVSHVPDFVSQIKIDYTLDLEAL